MKQSIFALTTLVTTALISSNVAYADPKADVQEIRSKYAAWMAAEVVTKNYDVDRALANHAPNFTETRIDGVLSREQIRQSLLNFHNPPYTSYVTAIEHSKYQIKFIGQTAKVHYNQKRDILVYNDNNYNNTKDLTSTPSTITGSYTDTWQRQGSGWKLVNSSLVEGNITSGKPQRVPASGDPEFDNMIRQGENIIRQGNAVENGWQFLRGVGVTP